MRMRFAIILLLVLLGATRCDFGGNNCGRYQIVATPGSEKEMPTILRIDTETGRTWWWNSGSWIRSEEAQPLR